MVIRPNNWREEDRVKFAEEVVDSIVSVMTDKEKNRIVADLLFDEMVTREWPDLWIAAEEYAPHLVESFLSNDPEETQRGCY